ncbi:MAG: DUF3316 domain-containing protein [Muribaculaceae bacterium]|nr:DUF3316 domain-containing protein [Muribaculaceae bacterium]
MRRLTAILIAILTIMLPAFADRKAEQHFEFSMGHESARCTYLSPLTYTGPGYGLAYEWRKPVWADGKAGMQTHADVSYGYLLNPAGTARMYDLSIALDWGAERLWSPYSGWGIAAGGTVGVDGGVMYLPRNGNNPAQAKMWVGGTLTLRASYGGLRLLGKRLVISERIEVPTIGCFFSPAYGETYYEIYVGNHDGLAHFGWWGNRPQVKSRLRVDWHLGKYALTLGFDYRYQGLECNHISTRTAVCSGLLGIRF